MSYEILVRKSQKRERSGRQVLREIGLQVYQTGK